MKTRKIGKAINALKEGKMAGRVGWPEGQMIFRQVPANVPMKTVPTMQSLPQTVKIELETRQVAQVKGEESPAFDEINYNNQIAMLHSNNSITAWGISPEDVLAEDWLIFN